MWSHRVPVDNRWTSVCDAPSRKLASWFGGSVARQRVLRTGWAVFMRMRFDAGADEEFEAACGLLVDRLVRWAEEQGLPVDGFMAEAALDYRHRATADGRL